MTGSPLRPGYNRAAELYETFARYAHAGGHFCGQCYSEEEIRYLTRTPIRDIDAKHAMQLLYETADHWESPDVYRHYLPRILELLGPPDQEEPLYPLHPFETMLSLDFRRWPRAEQQVVYSYMSEHPRGLSSEERAEWSSGLELLEAEMTAPGRENSNG